MQERGPTQQENERYIEKAGSDVTNEIVWKVEKGQCWWGNNEKLKEEKVCRMLRKRKYGGGHGGGGGGGGERGLSVEG